MSIKTRLFTYFLLVFLAQGCSLLAIDDSAPPVADVHIHFNWDHKELVSAKEALAILEKNNVVFAVVFSVPSDNALELSQISDGRVIPFFSPYIGPRSRHGWFRDKQVLMQARQGLQAGIYKGIGELHVVPGIGPRRDNPIFQELLAMAAEFNVPFNIHTDASDYRFLKPICQQHHQVRFLWAHAGGILGPNHSEKILKACPNLFIEFSARGPQHYGGMVDEKGRLFDGWKRVMMAYPDRFMIGTDPVWNAQEMNRWYEADEGWLHYDEILMFHRSWLKQLPPDVEKKIRLDNALTFFGVVVP